MKIVKRTFQAGQYPKGSAERNRLNEDTVTSEYMPSYKYAVVGEQFVHTTRTKREAEVFIQAKCDFRIKAEQS